jgi:hypothetical protein
MMSDREFLHHAEWFASGEIIRQGAIGSNPMM